MKTKGLKTNEEKDEIDSDEGCLHYEKLRDLISSSMCELEMWFKIS
jgi:hypothetical protein